MIGGNSHESALRRFLAEKVVDEFWSAHSAEGRGECLPVNLRKHWCQLLEQIRLILDEARELEKGQRDFVFRDRFDELVELSGKNVLLSLQVRLKRRRFFPERQQTTTRYIVKPPPDRSA